MSPICYLPLCYLKPLVTGASNNPCNILEFRRWKEESHPTDFGQVLQRKETTDEKHSISILQVWHHLNVWMMRQCILSRNGDSMFFVFFPKIPTIASLC